jgi:murein DD-endopeptidase MepM/ murein hydrolase activator NlpD
LAEQKMSIIVIPDGSRRVRRFRIGIRGLQLAAGVMAVFLLGVSWLAFDYCRTTLDRSELQRLRAANGSQQELIRSLSVDLENLRREMVVLAQNDAKVRLMAELAGPAPETPAGLGGPIEVDAAGELSELQQHIDQIRRDIDLRRQSLEEIQSFFNDQSSLLAAKPKGWPTKGWVTSGFGRRLSPFTGRRKLHHGYDIAARTGTPVLATANGVVSKVASLSDYGKIVVLDHGYGYQTCYAHNSKILVKVGQRVQRGEKIAAVGNTGRSTGSHLHYEVRLNGVPVNPKRYL